jgi:hypothetical protein
MSLTTPLTSLPNDALHSILEFAAESNVTTTCQSLRIINEEKFQEIWDRACQQWSENQTVQRYIDSIEAEGVFNHVVKFERLFAKMGQALGHVEPGALDELNVTSERIFDSAMYIQIAQRIQDRALETVWRQFPTINSILAPELPPVDTAEEIRTRLNQAAPETLNAIINQTPNIDLSNLSLHVLPDELSRFTRLEALTAKNCHLDFLPSWISNLQNLRELHVSNNQLTTVPKNIGRLHRLEIFIANYNQLKTIPKELFFCLELYILNLWENKIKNIPTQIGLLSKLQVLTLYANEISHLPYQIGQCTALTHLFLGPSVKLPMSIDKLKNTNIFHSKVSWGMFILKLCMKEGINSARRNWKKIAIAMPFWIAVGSYHILHHDFGDIFDNIRNHI